MGKVKLSDFLKGLHFNDIVLFSSCIWFSPPAPITGQHMFYWDIAVFASLTRKPSLVSIRHVWMNTAIIRCYNWWLSHLFLQNWYCKELSHTSRVTTECEF